MLGFLRRINSQSIRFFFATNQLTTNDKLLQLTEVHLRKVASDQKKMISKGRAWYAEELRLKSTEDLQKLWHVLLKEKNTLCSDNQMKKKYTGSIGRQGRLGHIKRSMARLLTVISERRKVREQYRQQLENEYVEKKRKEYEQQFLEEQNSQEIKLPQITPELLRSKWNYLKGGIDNHKYITDAIKREQSFKRKKAELLGITQQVTRKYWKKKKTNQSLDVLQYTLQNQIDKSSKVSQEQILRTHVKNWWQMNLKQKRIILGFINAKRARTVKSEFIKELSLLGQKIAYDQKQQQAGQ